MDREAKQHGGQSSSAHGEKITGQALEALRAGQSNKCHYSGLELTLENVSVDHKLPLSKGGRHAMSNVCLCTRAVNGMKQQMTEQEFVAMCLLIASHVPEKN